jgi:excinuclease UvrABC ATPase subunit
LEVQEVDIRIQGAKEHNLKDVDVDIGDGLTVVTGISGSLSFDKLSIDVYFYLDLFFNAQLRSTVSYSVS